MHPGRAIPPPMELAAMYTTLDQSIESHSTLTYNKKDLCRGRRQRKKKEKERRKKDRSQDESES